MTEKEPSFSGPSRNAEGPGDPATLQSLQEDIASMATVMQQFMNKFSQQGNINNKNLNSQPGPSSESNEDVVHAISPNKYSDFDQQSSSDDEDRPHKRRRFNSTRDEGATTGDVDALLAPASNNTTTEVNSGDLLSKINDEIYGEDCVSAPVSDQLAGIIDKCWQTKMQPEKLMSLLSKYNRPENCEKLTVPCVNPQIWNNLAKQQKMSEVRMSHVQESIVKACTAITRSLDHLITNQNDSGVLHGPLYYRELESHKVSALKICKGDFDRTAVDGGAVWNDAKIRGHWTEMRKMWLWAIERDIGISTAHIPGVLNVEVDKISRSRPKDSECQLDKGVFEQACHPANVRENPSKGAQGLCVFPDWPTHSWYPIMMKLLLKPPLCIKHSQSLLTLPNFPQTTKQGIHFKPIRYLALPSNKDLCVINNLTCYLAETQLLRKECRQLLISTAKPFQPVNRSTISRWCKDVLSNAGIDTEQIGAHSIRFAATSYATFNGLPLSVILNAAGWTRETTFEKYYHKTIDNRDDLNFG
eukprot:gene18477-20328_t